MNVPKKREMCWELMGGTLGAVDEPHDSYVSCHREDIYVRCQLPKGHTGMHAGAIATSTENGIAMRWATNGAGWFVTAFKI